MVGHDAPGFKAVVDSIAEVRVVDSIAEVREAEWDYFKKWRAKDQYCKQLEARIAHASFTNERLAQMTVALLEQVRELNRQLRELHHEREQA